MEVSELGDATLSALALSNAANASAIALTPAFAAGTTSYTASVRHAVAQVTVAPTVNDANASYEIQDENGDALTDADAATGFQVNLDVGANTIKVEVTAEQDSVKVYTLTVNRAEMPQNSPAGGAPAIAGAAHVGATLSAVTSTIWDSNGVAGVSYTYQWIRVSGSTESDISGATSSSYTLTSADQDKTVKVKVAFADEDGFAEELTSAAFPATGTIGANPSMAGPAPVSASVVSVGTFSSLEIEFDEDLDSANTPPTSAFTITATGDVMPIITGAIPTGHPKKYRLTLVFTRLFRQGEPVTVSYTDPSAGDDALALQDGDGNDATSFTLGAANNSTIPTVAPTKPPRNVEAVATGETSIRLTWDPPLRNGGSPITGYWISRALRAAGPWTTIQSDTGSPGTTYEDTGLSPATVYFYGLVALNANGGSLTQGTSISLPVSAKTLGNNPATGQPNITGKSEVDETLSAALGTIADGNGLPTFPDDFTFQWVRVDADGASNPTDVGTDSQTYQLVAADEGKKIKVKVGFTDNDGFDEELTSAALPATGTIGANTQMPGPEPVSATVLDFFGYFNGLEIEFDKNLDGTNTPPTSAFTITATGDVMPIQTGAVPTGSPKAYRLYLSDWAFRQGEPVTVSYTDPSAGDDALALQDGDGNDAASFTLAATNNSTTPAVSPSTPPRNVEAVATGETSIRLTWDPPARNGGRPVTGYGISRALSAAGPWTHIQSDTGSPGTTYEDTGLSPGTVYHYRLYAINAIGGRLTSGVLAGQNVSRPVSAKTQGNSPATGQPDIAGTPELDETLTAKLGTIADGNGLPTFPDDFSFQWVRVDADGVSNPTDVGTDSQTYALVAADEGKKIKVEVGFTDGDGTSETRTSDATATVRDADDQPTPTVTIIGKTPDVAEGDSVWFTLGRSESSDAGLVEFEVSQQGDFLTGDTSFGATIGATPATVSVPFAAGEPSKLLGFHTDDDYWDEQNGSVTLTIVSDPNRLGYAVGTPSADTATVRDDDEPITLTFDIQGITSDLSEGDAITIYLYRNEINVQSQVQLEVSQQGDFLTGDTSFGATFGATPATVPVDFAVGENMKFISLYTDDDYVDEEDGSVTVTVVSDPGRLGYLVDAPGARTATVRDNDDPLTLALDASPAAPVPGVPETEVEEGEGILVELTRSRNAGPQTVDLEISQVGEFLAASHPGGQTLPADGRIQASFADGALSTSVRLATDDDEIEENDGSVTITVLARLDDPGYPDFGQPETMTVRDNDAPPTVTIAADTASVTEGEPVTFTVTRSQNPGEHDRAMFVQLRVTPTGDVLAHGSHPVTLQSYLRTGAASDGLFFNTVDDQVAAPNGSVLVEVLPASQGDEPYAIGTPDSATVEVVDNEPPRVWVWSPPRNATVTEGSDVVFDFTRFGGGGSTGSLTIGVNIQGHDKTMSPATRLLAAGQAPHTTVTFAPGSNDATLTLTTEDDQVNEGDGELRVIIRPSADYQVHRVGSATVLVEDDDVPEVSLRWISPTLTLQDNVWSGELIEGSPIEYEVDCSGNTLAPDQSDPYTGGINTRLRIVAQLQEDLNHPLHAHYDADYHHRVPCADQPLPRFGVHFGSVSRRYTGHENGELSVDLRPQELLPLQESIYQCYLDSSPLAPSNVRFCPKYTLGAVTSARITVVNRNPTVYVEAIDDEVDEGEPARFRVTRLWAADLLDPLNGYTTTVDYSMSATGGYVTSPLPTGPYTFAQTVAETVIEVPTVRDNIQGADGEVTLELTPGTPESQAVNIGGSYEVYDHLADITPPGKNSRIATVRVKNLDTLPALSVADVVAEEGEAVEFVVKKTGTHTNAITVDWSLADGTAESGTDYTHASGTLTFAANETEKTIRVDTVEDDIEEDDETFTLTLSNPVDSTFVTGTSTVSVTGTITNDDHLQVITIEPEATPILEGETVTFVLKRTGDTTDSLGVFVLFLLPGETETRLTRIGFAAGETTQTHSFETVHDEYIEDNVVYTASIARRNGVYAKGTPDSATITVLDDDGRALTLTRGFPTTFSAEGETLTFSYTATNDGVLETAARVEIVDSVAGTISCGSQPLLGEGSGGGNNAEGLSCDTSHTYTVTAEDAAAGFIESTAYATDGLVESSRVSARIVSNAPYYELTPNSPAVDEDDGSITFTVTRSGYTADASEVQYRTVDGTAEAGEDYTAVDGSLSFAANATTGTFSVSVTDDGLDEDTETFEVVLVPSGGFSRVLDRSEVSIADNDPTVTLELDLQESYDEGHGVIEVPVSLSLGLSVEGTVVSGRRVEVVYATTDDSAVAGEDYDGVSGRLVFERASRRRR